MARTQKNKATSGHLGMLKAKLAKLRRDLLEPKGGGGAKGEGWSMFVCFISWLFFNLSKICAMDCIYTDK